MPIEIKELVIRAFVSDQKEKESPDNDPREVQINNSEASLAMVANMLKQEKER